MAVIWDIILLVITFRILLWWAEQNHKPYR